MKCKLSEICSFTTGKLNSNAAVENGKYPFFTCSPETLKINDYAFDQEAILLAGNNAEGNFNIKYYVGKFNAYQRTYVFSAAKNCYLKYLYYSLKLCLENFKQISQGTATKFLTAKILNSFEIELPSLDIQKKIASILTNLDDKIELNNAINYNLQQQAQAIFKSWFIDFEPFGGKMPDDWEVESLLDIADYLNGLAMQKFRPENSDMGLSVLKIKELRQGFCDNDSERCSSQINSQYVVNNGDVIFSWSGSLLVDFWCGGKCGLNQHLFKVTSNKFDKWFYYSWTMYHLQEFSAIAAGKATTMGHIKREDLGKARVIVPSINDYEQIEKLLKPIYSQIISNRVENSKLSALRDTLLPKLMSGELDVSEVEI